jgi:hypothetical protein
VRESLRNARWPVIAPVLVYLLLSLSGSSYSSIGIDQLRQTPGEHAGIMLGTPLSVRSDEWATSTPALLRVMATGSTDDLNPLTADDQFLHSLPAGPVSAVVVLDRWVLQLGPWLPDQVLYSAALWFPMLLLALGAPAWFARVTGSPRIGWLAVALLVLSPLTVWWSFGPVATLGPLFAGCAALLRSYDAAVSRRFLAAIAWGVATALLLSRTVYGYQPWSVVLGSAVLGATVAYLLVPRAGRRPAFAVLGGAGAATLATLAAVVLENRATLTTLTGTVYPGQRRAEGFPSPLQDIFAAPVLGVLRDDPVITASNASEVSSSFGFTLVWAALLMAAVWRPAPRPHRAAILVLGAVTAAWFAWSTLSLGDLAGAIPLLSMVPQARAADVVGMLGVVVVCLVLPVLPDLGGRRVAVVSALATGAMTAYAGSLLRLASVPTLTLAEIYVASAVVAAAVLAITLRPRRPYGYVVAVAGATLLVWNVNPFLVGLGDLRGSASADALIGEADEVRASGEVWASDAYAVDSLLTASGVPSLSGRQMAGPDREAWGDLAPGVDESVWNRGGAFVWFQWRQEPGVEISNPSADVILLQASPCTVAERLPALRTIVASRELDAPCLKKIRSFDWGDGSRIVYAVSVEPRGQG